MYQVPKCRYSYLSQALEFHGGCFFPVSILNRVLMLLHLSLWNQEFGYVFYEKLNVKVGNFKIRHIVPCAIFKTELFYKNS